MLGFTLYSFYVLLQAHVSQSIMLPYYTNIQKMTENIRNLKQDTLH
jgi:hypothetical protein